MLDSRFRGNDKHWCHPDFLRDHQRYLNSLTQKAETIKTGKEFFLKELFLDLTRNNVCTDFRVP